MILTVVAIVAVGLIVCVIVWRFTRDVDDVMETLDYVDQYRASDLAGDVEAYLRSEGY